MNATRKEKERKATGDMEKDGWGWNGLSGQVMERDKLAGSRQRWLENIRWCLMGKIKSSMYDKKLNSNGFHFRPPLPSSDTHGWSRHLLIIWCTPPPSKLNVTNVERNWKG
jgi:hypothetical protein